MPRITQRLAASFAALVVAAGVFAALPVGVVRPAAASPQAAARSFGGARGLLDAQPSLTRIISAELRAADDSQQLFASAFSAAPDLLAQLPDRPFWIDGSGPRLRGELIAQTERLDIYVGIGTFSPEQIAALAPQLEQILRDNEYWYGQRLSHRVSLGFFRPAAAEINGARGIAYTDHDRAEVYFAGGEDIDRALVVTAHELAHHLEKERFGNEAQKRADTILHEGLATWITGGRWLAMVGASTWQERGQQLRDAGVPLRLATAEQYGANNAYELWASFVHYLLRFYGWEKFDTLYASGRSRYPGSADYQGVYGKSLNELADEWRAWLNS
ncbi:MAG: hypothetical protein H7Z42_05360 [Roseiflexaceae bacterium]|nr:hypothetical protein [Roseiflexaceae bacterium]